MIPKFKYGDCQCGCGGKDVEGRKVGKVFYCISSYQQMKTKQYNSNQRLNSKVKKLGIEQIRNGNYEDASRQDLINDLDFVFSRLIRQTYADSKTGLCFCYTCDCPPKHWSLLQNSHFIKRSHTLLRWDSNNARPACKHCNEDLGGNLSVYTKKLNEEHKGLVERLREQSLEPHKWTINELKVLLIDLRAKLRLIESKFK